MADRNKAARIHVGRGIDYGCSASKPAIVSHPYTFEPPANPLFRSWRGHPSSPSVLRLVSSQQPHPRAHTPEPSRRTSWVSNLTDMTRPVERLNVAQSSLLSRYNEEAAHQRLLADTHGLFVDDFGLICRNSELARICEAMWPLCRESSSYRTSSQRSIWQTTLFSSQTGASETTFIGR